jgi:hypothetical protein
MYPERHYQRKTLNIILASSVPCPLKFSSAQCCSAGRSSYFSLNAIAARFGCLHPATILHLYKPYCSPVLLYLSELWNITRTELIMIERIHRKILRTILGLLVRCNSKSLLHIMGTLSINAFIHQGQLNFIHSFTFLPPDSLPLLC